MTNILLSDEFTVNTETCLMVLRSIQNKCNGNLVKDTNVIDKSSYDDILRKVKLGIEEGELLLQLYKLIETMDDERMKLCVKFDILDRENKWLKDELTEVRGQLEKKEEVICQLEEINKHLTFVNEVKKYDGPYNENNDLFYDETSKSSELSIKDQSHDINTNMTSRERRTTIRDIIISKLLSPSRKSTNIKTEHFQKMSYSTGNISIPFESSADGLNAKETNISFYRAFDIPRKKYNYYQFEDFIDLKESISEVWWYKCRLTNIQISCYFVNYQFIVFKTNEYFWSVEKNYERINIQIAHFIEDVTDRNYIGKERCKGVTKLDSAKGKIKVFEIINFILSNDATGNNKFASDIFKKIKC